MSLFTPANSFMSVHRQRIRDSQYNEWKSNMSPIHIQKFCKHGLLPFLKHNGYTIDGSIQLLYERVDEWAFCHVLKASSPKSQECIFTTCNHDGGKEEREWYDTIISTSDWHQFAEMWSESEFLDDSDAGFSQLYGLSDFVWHLINLENSKAHHNWLYINDIMNYQDELQGGGHPSIHDEMGDRRTY